MFTFKPVLRHDFCADVCVRTLRKWLTTCADRITRSILYDFTELENASRLKKGEETRTAIKTANVAKWFGKVDADLSELLAYF